MQGTADPNNYPGRFVRVAGPCDCGNPNHDITLDWGPVTIIWPPVAPAQHRPDRNSLVRSGALDDRWVPPSPHLLVSGHADLQPAAPAPGFTSTQQHQSHRESGLRAVVGEEGATGRTTPLWPPKLSPPEEAGPSAGPSALALAEACGPAAGAGAGAEAGGARRRTRKRSRAPAEEPVRDSSRRRGQPTTSRNRKKYFG